MHSQGNGVRDPRRFVVASHAGSVADLLSSERRYGGGCVFALARVKTLLTASNSRRFRFVAQRKATAAEDALEPLRRELALLKAGAASHAEVCTPRFPPRPTHENMQAGGPPIGQHMGIYRQMVLLLANTWEYTRRWSSYWPTHGNIQADGPPIGQHMGIYRQMVLLLANAWEYTCVEGDFGLALWCAVRHPHERE
eukprot:1191424-Prorocentrum_minimum.AAC.9